MLLTTTVDLQEVGKAEEHDKISVWNGTKRARGEKGGKSRVESYCWGDARY